jgi:glycosyltransferase involved in cell wall biosynthesis
VAFFLLFEAYFFWENPVTQDVRSDTRPPAAPALPADLWVVIAALNESGRIGPVLDELLRIVQHVVVVDDGSHDGTGEQVLARSAWLLKHPTNLGQGAALQTGITFALSQGASHIVTFDADGQHTPEDIPELLGALGTENADYALGSRFLGHAENIPATRKVLLRLAIVFTRVLSGVSLSDTHNGIRAMTRRGAEQIHITFNRMEHASEVIDQIAASALKYVEVPVRVRYTADSLGKGQRGSAALGLGIRLLLSKVAR